MNRTELVQTHGVVGHDNLSRYLGEPLTGLGHSLKRFGKFGFGFVTHGGQKSFGLDRWFDFVGYGCFCATSGYATFHN